MSVSDCVPTHSELISLLPSSSLPDRGMQDSWLALAIRSALPSLSGCCGTRPFTEGSLLPSFSLQQSHILLLLPESEQEQPAPTTPSFLMQGKSCLQQQLVLPTIILTGIAGIPCLLKLFLLPSECCTHLIPSHRVY